MNHYYTTFQKNESIFETSAQWRNYGLKSFKNLLKHLGYPPSEDLGFLDKLMLMEEFAPGATIQEQDAICKKFYFIIKGSVRIGSVREGTSATFALFNEGNIASSLFEFFEQDSSTYGIDAISPTICLSMDMDSFLIAAEFIGKENIDRIVNTIKDNFLKYLMWFQGIQPLSFEAKIKSLFLQYPLIIQNFKDDDVAKLLGMTRETYNRLKKKIFAEQK